MSTRQRQTIRASAIASIASGAPSTLIRLRRTRSLGDTTRYVVDATTAIGELVPPGRPGLIRGAAAHLAISAAMGDLLARTLPREHRIVAGAAAGALMGVVNVGLIGRRYESIRALPFGPQLADNVAFGVLIAIFTDPSGAVSDASRSRRR